MKMKYLKALLVCALAVVLTCCFTFLTACDPEETPNENEHTVTFDLNYEGAPAAQTQNIEDGATVAEPSEPVRDGYTFDGWYLEAGCVNSYSFAEPVTEDITLYAGWLDDSKTYYTITFDYNYAGAPEDIERSVESGTTVTPPDVTRENATFLAWCAQPDGGAEFDFTAPITSDMTLYAQWEVTYIFEAEYVDLSGMYGAGWAGGNASGQTFIGYDETGSGQASNQFFLSYLYREGVTVRFVIQSAAEVDDATLVMRLAGEGGAEFTITSDIYTVMVNGTAFTYDDITFKDVPTLGQPIMQFQDYVVAEGVHLNAGENVIELITTNATSMGGTTAAIAPMVDCIKITTSADLTWQPKLSNTEGLI